MGECPIRGAEVPEDGPRACSKQPVPSLAHVIDLIGEWAYRHAAGRNVRDEDSYFSGKGLDDR